MLCERYIGLGMYQYMATKVINFVIECAGLPMGMPWRLTDIVSGGACRAAAAVGAAAEPVAATVSAAAVGAAAEPLAATVSAAAAARWSVPAVGQSR